MQFLYQPLTWGFLLVLAPLAIHLINLTRQRRVQWGAMEFLLQAHRKHRKWIWLRQMLLLATRMLAIAVVVAMLAHLVTRKEWTALFGDHTTHHYVLLDDSFSMSDRSGSSSAFDRASRAVSQFSQRLMASDVSQKLTLIRWSQAERAAFNSENPTPTGEPSPQVMAADLTAVQMDAEAEETVSERLRSLAVSPLAAGPQAAIEYTQQLVEQNPNETAIVHLVSDFRRRDWQQAAATFAALKELSDQVADFQLVDCVESQHENLAITLAKPMDGTLAAGVPVQLEVEVRNFGANPARQVPIFVTTKSSAGELSDPGEEIPAVLIDEIPPGEAVRRQVQIFFPAAGQHVVLARVSEDSVELDNYRWCVVDLPALVPVLLIDGDAEQRNATYFRNVFQPSDRVATGIAPDVRPVRFLSTVTAEALAKYHAVYLCDVNRLDPEARANLERYVRDGGGLGIFVGPNVDWQGYDDWYQQGTGLFPVGLTAPRFLNAAEERAALAAEAHPTMRLLSGDNNPFAASIRFSRYLGISEAGMGAGVDVIARLGNGQPIMLERRFGQGRVVVMLSTLAPLWNNWATQPSFVVFLLELQSYLDSLQPRVTSEQVGTALEFPFDPQLFQPELVLRTPGAGLEDPGEEVTIRLNDPQSGLPPASEGEGEGEAEGEAEPPLRTQLTVAGPNLPAPRSTDRAGIYEVVAKRLDGTPVRQRQALNVDSQEGSLALFDRSRFAQQFGREVQLVMASDVALSEGDDDRFSWSTILLWMLPLLLVFEQFLAYTASYHPARKGAA